MTAASRWTVALAVVATATALCLSVLAGWQRGGTLPERVVWIALGIVLVVSAHLLPALVRGASPVVRGVAAVLWAACMTSACYGHATFFLLAQQHAGEARANAVTVAIPVASGRSLVDLMTERATATRQLAWARLQRCSRDCSQLESRRVMLAAKLDALEAEADDVRRHQAAEDRVTTQRDALRADPVTARLATLLGTTVTRLDLLAGLMFAAVLEGVACLLWTVALQSRTAVTDAPVTSTVLTPVTTVPGALPDTAPLTSSVTKPLTQPDMETDTEPEPVRHDMEPAARIPVRARASSLRPVETPDAELARLVTEVTEGRVRATVYDIRRYLGCSQARAAALRRQLAERNVTA
ncbi:hypothetical protein AB4Y32_00915 [Paraburkholderia phymatum]|uniref:Uncharacterized protein n=1 Tax=Paraburkholderia phymatum TaxID=148447 RepID=A0ACC6TSX9_9BURK